MSVSLSDPTMRLFVVCAAILVLKMSVTSLATAVFRNLRGVFVSPEDYAFRRKPPREPDEQIERIRRAHHNDLEAILPFLAVGFLAAATGAVSYRVAWWLFVPFTTARILHTIAYSRAQRARQRDYQTCCSGGLLQTATPSSCPSGSRERSQEASSSTLPRRCCRPAAVARVSRRTGSTARIRVHCRPGGV